MRCARRLVLWSVALLFVAMAGLAQAQISSLANRNLEQLSIAGGALSVNVSRWGGSAVTGGAGAVAAGTPRVTLASDDPAVVALQIMDDWDEANRAAVNLIAGQVGVAGGTGVDAANALRVSLATNIPLPAGTNNIGDVDVLSVIPGTGATSLGKAEDAGHTSGDTGVMALAVRNDVRGTLAGLDLDYAPLQLNASGDVRVDGSAVTQPVSGTVTANQGTANATPWNENIAQINGITPLMGNGVTGTGSQRVTVASDNTPFPIRIDQTTPGTTNRVDVGTFPDNEPFNVAQINGVTPLMGNGITGTGSQRVTIASDNTAFTVNIGTFPDNEPFNVAQFGGSAVVTGTGAGGAGIPRVTVSSDSSLAANQSVNISQINGVTPLMGAGVTGTGSPRISIATDANVVDTELPAVAALTDNTVNPTTTGAASYLMCYDGATWDRCPGSTTTGVHVSQFGTTNPQADSFTNTPTIATSQVGTQIMYPTMPRVYNGDTWDRARSGSATSTQPHYGAALSHRAGGAFTFLASTAHVATTVLAAQTGLGGFNNLVVTWDVTAAERDSANETYDLYVTCGDGVSTWDVAHFPQIITTGAKRYTAFIHGQLFNQNVTTAVPGVAANDPGTFKTDTVGADQGTRILAAGVIRHGSLGDRCGADIVIAGTIVTGITHSITMTVKP